MRYWYCEAGIESAFALAMTARADYLTDSENRVNVRMVSLDEIHIELLGEIRDEQGIVQMSPGARFSPRFTRSTVEFDR
jgi:hypothetical protein